MQNSEQSKRSDITNGGKPAAVLTVARMRKAMRVAQSARRLGKLTEATKQRLLFEMDARSLSKRKQGEAVHDAETTNRI